MYLTFKNPMVKFLLRKAAIFIINRIMLKSIIPPFFQMKELTLSKSRKKSTKDIFYSFLLVVIAPMRFIRQMKGVYRVNLCLIES